MGARTPARHDPRQVYAAPRDDLQSTPCFSTVCRKAWERGKQNEVEILWKPIIAIRLVAALTTCRARGKGAGLRTSAQQQPHLVRLISQNLR